MNKVRKAVIPAAGYGTRMLPITKVVPKEMLPLVDRPIIQYVVEELVEAGIEELIIILAEGKREVADYFGDTDECLARHLQSKGPDKVALLRDIENVKHMAKFTFVELIEEPGVYGTGNPVLCAEPYLDNEPFIYTFADDFFVASKNSYTQMLEAYETYQAPVIGCQRRTADGDYDRYGYVGGTELAPDEMQVSAIVEHPGKANKPSDFASLGGFVVTPDVLPHLHEVRKNLPKGQEIYFHASLSLMLDAGKKVIAKEITNAEYFDTGNKLEYMKTAVTMASRHPEIGKDFQKFLQEYVKTEG
jgi:UTP--glucose-1-phosphate uridylyltransferase